MSSEGVWRVVRRWLLPFPLMLVGYYVMPDGASWARVLSAIVFQAAAILWWTSFKEQRGGA